MDCRVKPGNDEKGISFSRRISAPELWQGLSEIVTTGLDPVVHEESQCPNAGGSAVPAKLSHGLPGLRPPKGCYVRRRASPLRPAGGSNPAMTKERTERTKESVGGETPTDARLFCRGSGHGRASQRRGAHLSAFHRGSRPKESFIARDAASGQASWDAASLLSGCYPPLPVPVQRQHLALRS